MSKRVVPFLIGVLILSSCGMLEELVPGFSRSCSSYNGDRDSFRISLEHTYWSTEPGVTFTANYDADWLNDDLQRRTLNCSVNWQIADTSVLEAGEADNTFNVLGPGFTEVTATITGSGGAKQVRFEVAAFPLATEMEPNNGTGSANPLVHGSAEHGTIDYSGDVDYFSFTVPAGHSYQIDLSDGVDLSQAEHFRPSSLSGRIEDVTGRWQGEVHRTYTNDLEEDVTLYVVVSGRRGDNLTPRYSVLLHVVEP